MLLSDVPTVMKFDQDGKLVKAFGAGLLVFPHGIYVDPDGNVWVTDGQDNGDRRERGDRFASAGRVDGLRCLSCGLWL